MGIEGCSPTDAAGLLRFLKAMTHYFTVDYLRDAEEREEGPLSPELLVRIIRALQVGFLVSLRCFGGSHAPNTDMLEHCGP